MFEKLKNKINSSKDNLKNPKKHPRTSIEQTKKEGLFSFLKRGSKLGSANRPSRVKEDIVALEIMEDRCYIAQLAGTAGNWRLSKFDYTQFDSPINFEEESSRKYAGRVISGLLKRSDISTKSVALCVPVENAIIRTIEAPLMNDEELEAAIKTKTLWENLIQIGNEENSTSFEDYSIYHQVVSKNTERNTMELLFVASKLSDIEKIVQIATEASLKPVVIDVSCFSIKSAVDINKTVENDTVQTTAVLNIGSKENYLMIIQGNEHFITQIYVDPKELKTFKDSENDPSAVFPFMSKYCLLVEQAVVEFNSKAKQTGRMPVSVIEVASPINALPNVIATLSNQLTSLDIRVLNVIELIKIPEHLKKKVSILNNPSVASSVIGLATRKLDVYGYYKFIEAVKNINLLPNRDEVVDRVVRKRRLKFSSIIAAIFIAIATSAFSYYFIDINTKFKSVQSEHERVLKNNQEKIKELRIVVRSINDVKRAIKKLEQVGSNKEEAYRAFIILKNSINSQIILDVINYEKSGKIYINGRAKSDDAIVAFMDKVRGNKEIDQVTIESMNNNVDTGLKEFAIVCSLAKRGDNE